MILNCYRLAKYYGVPPDVFLNKPLSRIARDIKYTNMLIADEVEAREHRDA
jgi:hypothetical protein